MPSLNPQRLQSALPLFGREWWETTPTLDLNRWVNGTAPLPSKDWHAERLPSDPPCAWNEWRSHRRGTVTPIRAMEDIHLQHAWRFCSTKRTHVSRLAPIWAEMVRRGMEPPRYREGATDTVFVLSTRTAAMAPAPAPTTPPEPAFGNSMDEGPIDALDPDLMDMPVEVTQPVRRARRARSLTRLSDLAIAQRVVERWRQQFPAGANLTVTEDAAANWLCFYASWPAGERRRAVYQEINIPMSDEPPRSDRITALLQEMALRAVDFQPGAEVPLTQAAPVRDPFQQSPTSVFREAYNRIRPTLPPDWTASIDLDYEDQIWTIAVTFPDPASGFRRVIQRIPESVMRNAPQTIVTVALSEAVVEARQVQSNLRQWGEQPAPPPAAPPPPAEEVDPWEALPEGITSRAWAQLFPIDRP